MKGKHLSQFTKIFGIAWVIVMFFVNGAMQLGYSAWDIIQVGLFILGTGAPIDVSMWLDKIGNRFGKSMQ